MLKMPTLMRISHSCTPRVSQFAAGQSLGTSHADGGQCGLHRLICVLWERQQEVVCCELVCYVSMCMLAAVVCTGC